MTLVCFGTIAIVIVAGIWGRWWQTPVKEQLRRQCRDALHAHRWKVLQQYSTRWTTLDPQSGEAWMFLARALQKQGRFARAVDCLESVPDAAAEKGAAQLAEIELQFDMQNRPEDGAKTCQQVLKRDPHAVNVRRRLMFFLAMTLQRVRLIREIRRAMEAHAAPPEAYVYLFFADSESLHFSNGVAVNSRWLSGNPHSELFEVAEAVFIAQTLDASISMDDRKAAEATRHAQSRKGPVMAKLLRRYPHNLELLAYHLRESALAGDMNRVVALLAQAPVEAEGDNRFWRFKGWVHAHRNEFLKAEKAYRHALKLHPLDWSTRHLLAELLQRQQRYQEVEQLRKLVNRANVLRRELDAAPNARQVPRKTLVKLAAYAADCGDTQTAAALQWRLREHFGISSK